MMDLKEIIKWFIPCFHILQVILKLKDLRLTFICLFLLFFRVGCAANVNSGLGVSFNAKNIHYLVNETRLGENQSDVSTRKLPLREITTSSVGRTFGRPFKKMMAGLLPVIFQIGAASTWAVVAALVGVKTLIISLVILKILLIAGAVKTLAVIHNGLNDKLREEAFRTQWLKHPKYGVVTNSTNDWVQMQKVGALFGSKGHGHYSQGWEPPHHPQKEIHLHIHNGHHEGHDEHVPVYGAWSRDDAANAIDSKHDVIDPYSVVGPQTIRTPFGNYVKVESSNPLTSTTKRK